MNFQLLLLRAGLICKNIAPKDTFNLASSIITYPTARGGRITQLSSVALYGSILNEGPAGAGSRVTRKHIQWWDIKCVYGVSHYAQSFYNGTADNLSATYQQIAKQAVNTPARAKAFLRNQKAIGSG
jgi:hypothetical protein